MALVDVDPALADVLAPDFLLVVFDWGVAAATLLDADFAGAVSEGADLLRGGFLVVARGSTFSMEAFALVRVLTTRSGRAAACRVMSDIAGLAVVVGFCGVLLTFVWLLRVRTVVRFGSCTFAAVRGASLPGAGVVDGRRESCLAELRLAELRRATVLVAVVAGCCGAAATSKFGTALPGRLRRVTGVAIE
ncbi:MAG TPA: hypothetical protein VF600_07130 [Abditibacteriaceae bacterium]|jgi:hypothetical protein